MQIHAWGCKITIYQEVARGEKQRKMVDFASKWDKIYLSYFEFVSDSPRIFFFVAVVNASSESNNLKIKILDNSMTVTF